MFEIIGFEPQCAVCQILQLWNVDNPRVEFLIDGTQWGLFLFVFFKNKQCQEYLKGINEHSVEEWGKHPTCFSKVGGSIPSSGVFPPKLSQPLAVFFAFFHSVVGAFFDCCF